MDEASLARDRCESYCSREKSCWGCSVDCSTTCQWNAITDCGTYIDWKGIITGDVSLRPGKYVLGVKYLSSKMFLIKIV